MNGTGALRVDVSLAERDAIKLILDFFQQPAIEVAVPIQVWRPKRTTTCFRLVAAGFFPLFAACRAAACRIEGVPNVFTSALPNIGRCGFPITFGAGNFYLGHVNLSLSASFK